jgi:kynurenine 3-monooxygenase
MRDKVASPLFHAKKRFEKLLHALFPKWFVPLYTMVSFTRVPYAEARDRARRQWRIVGGVLGVAVLVILALT